MQEPVSPLMTRSPAVAGMFYPADPQQMQHELAALFNQPSPQQQQRWRAAMVPHAGWVYSGRIAAAVFQRVRIPQTVVILCPKHRAGGAQWAIEPHRTWAFPGGSVAADLDLAQQLAASVDGLQFDAVPHQQEHAIEVQLPLLAYLAPQVQVVGITVGKADHQSCLGFAEAMAAVIREKNDSVLLVISSDMNHFASDEANRNLDELALESLDRLDTTGLVETCRTNQISMCGLMPAVIVLETLRHLDALHRSQRVAYATSANANGDQSCVVGYAGMLFG